MTGESVASFYDNTIAENIVCIEADKRREYVKDRRLRLSLYTLSLPNIKESDRVNIYDWMPLHGDPTKEERMKDEEKEMEGYKEIFKRMQK